MTTPRRSRSREQKVLQTNPVTSSVEGAELIEGEVVDEDPRGSHQDPSGSSDQQEAAEDREQESLSQEDQGPKPGSSGWWQRMNERARASVGDEDPWSRRRDEATVEGRYRDERDGMVRGGDPRSQLQENIRAAGLSYNAQLRRSGLLDSERPEAERASTMSDLQRVYALRMVLSLHESFTPRRGPDGKMRSLGVNDVLRTVGMATAMYTLSPNLRDYVNEVTTEHRQKLGTSLKDGVESKLEQMRLRRFYSADAAVRAAEFRGDSPTELLLERRDRLLSKVKGRELYTADSAAMVELALNDNLFEQMRQEGANVPALRQAHQAMVGHLYGMAEEDGVDAQDIARSSRGLLGRRILEDPEVAARYEQLGHGIATTTPLTTAKSPDGRSTTRWDGGFQDAAGRRVIQGTFNVRAPMLPEDHQAAMMDAMASDMLTSADPTELQQKVQMYAFGSIVGRHPDLSRRVKNPEASRQLKVLHSMRTSMLVDGMEESQADQCYAESYFQALQEVSERRPELEQIWMAQYGERLQESMEQMVNDPESYFARYESPQQEQSPRAHGAGRGREDRKRESSDPREPQRQQGLDMEWSA